MVNARCCTVMYAWLVNVMSTPATSNRGALATETFQHLPDTATEMCRSTSPWVRPSSITSICFPGNQFTMFCPGTRVLYLHFTV
ncbi:uncharacterized protein B0T15DRAFT_102361 [Chaetomium strumarium]|uniref:Uncharacterized protein n=1 Tax=Chaetomium strumarium TaxID=1170767 RepID=A0AAJ0GXY8_9PEZI|nr:hypothetical protein B0T15DRAFT_102361 [Chaetomium strumarium]